MMTSSSKEKNSPKHGLGAEATFSIIFRPKKNRWKVVKKLCGTKSSEGYFDRYFRAEKYVQSLQSEFSSAVEDCDASGDSQAPSRRGKRKRKRMEVTPSDGECYRSHPEQH